MNAKPYAPPAPGERRRRSPADRASLMDRTVRASAYLLVLIVSGAGTAWAVHSQARIEANVHQDFIARSAMSAEFVATYAEQLLDRERKVAVSLLSEPGTPRFDQVSETFGFHASLLLDSDGRVLAATPPAPGLLGKQLGGDYVHLQQALQGRPTVSKAVASAAEGLPVIAFAVPYDTPEGRRVFSGAYLVKETPIREYLNAMSALPGFRAYVVDGDGGVVDASGPALTAVETLAVVAPDTERALRGRSAAVDGAGRYVTSTDIQGTPWRLVTSVPEPALLTAARGQVTLKVAGLALLTVVGMISCWLGLRLRDQRRELRHANSRLDDLAHIDDLTGLANRRRLDERLLAEHDRCRRDQRPMSVLLIDIDHFKRVNDTFGHTAGDEVLRAVAERIDGCLRAGDTSGRWGGEEFLIVLPGTPAEEAAGIAERIRAAVCGSAFTVGAGGDLLDVTVSIGCYGDTTSHPDVLVNVADRALYAAKGAGRNRVVMRERPRQTTLVPPARRGDPTVAA